MDVSFATAAAPGRRNEDLVVATDEFVIVLDGVTSPPHVVTGCRHDPVWLVRTLAAALAGGLMRAPAGALDAILADAVAAVRAAHVDTCDLGHPESPSSTVSILRERESRVDYLVLCDSGVVLADGDGRVLRAVSDDRTAAMRGLTRAEVAARRNHAGGFWVASTDPACAAEALTGSVPAAALGSALVCTDGVSRLVDAYGWDWSSVLALGEPSAMLRAVREAERDGPPPGSSKQHDDATVALCRFHSGP